MGNGGWHGILIIAGTIADERLRFFDFDFDFDAEALFAPLLVADPVAVFDLRGCCHATGRCWRGRNDVPPRLGTCCGFGFLVFEVEAAVRGSLHPREAIA